MARQPLLRNALLAGLPPDEWSRLRPDLQRVDMDAQATLHEARRLIEHVHFPLEGCVSLLVELADDFSAEVVQIGSEGMVGIPVVLGHTESTAVARVQIAGTALRVGTDVLARHLVRLPTLRRRLLHHAGLQVARSMQVAACNTHHGLDARLARCLLGLHDRCRGDELGLSVDDLGSLLCARRPSIAVGLRRFEQRGLIRQRVGSITIADRAGLEQASCECYAVVRDFGGAEDMG